MIHLRIFKGVDLYVKFVVVVNSDFYAHYACFIKNTHFRHVYYQFVVFVVKLKIFKISI